jgi:putative peptidoglycan lipid II flippase
VTVLGYLFAIVLPPRVGIAAQWGAAGLTASAGIAGWCEFALLRRSLNARIGRSGVDAARLAKLWTAAAVAAAIGWLLRGLVGPGSPILRAVVVLGPFGVAFFGIAAALGVPIPAWRRARG